MTRLLIADDQPEVRQALRTIARAGGHEVVGEAVDGLAAVGQAERRKPDVVLMDVRMPRLDRLEATRRITRTAGAPAVVVLTTYDLDDYVFGALRCGAVGFLLKSSPPADILAAIAEAAAGRGLIAPAVTRRLIERFAEQSPRRAEDPLVRRLSQRERDVLLLIDAGMTNAQIAAELVLEETTVESHVSRLFARLAVTSRAQAVIFAYETGLVSP